MRIFAQLHLSEPFDWTQSRATLDVCDERRIRGCPTQNALADSEAGSNQSNHLNSCKRGATRIAPPCNGSEAIAVAFTFAASPVLEKTNPRASAVDRSWPANLSASLRSGPGASGGQAPRRLLQRLSRASLSDEYRVSLSIAL